jgi:hypothetical protein
MTALAWLELIASGLITGAVYALVGLGLNLQYGLMRILNIAHGEFLMLGAFLTWMATTSWGLNPLLMIPVSFGLLMALGIAIHRLTFKRLAATSPDLDVFEARGLMVAFGLMFLVQNFAQVAWGADLRGYDFLTEPVALPGGGQFAGNKLVLLGLSLAFSAALIVVLRLTLWGKGVRALMQSPAGAQLVGIDTAAQHGLHDLALDGRALHGDGAHRHHARRLRAHGRRALRRAGARRDRSRGHALHEPVAEVALELRRVHRRLALEAQRPVQPTQMKTHQPASQATAADPALPGRRRCPPGGEAAEGRFGGER